MYRLAIASGFAAWSVLVFTGCSQSPPPKTEDPKTSNLRRISQALQLAEDRSRKPPRDEEELKTWLAGLGEPGTPESFLISEQDGLPFVIFYGKKIDPGAKDVIVAYEQLGAEGQRYVLTLAGYVKLLTDVEFENSPFAGKRP